MNCPSCRKTLKNSNASGVDTLACKRCHGLWVSYESMATLLKVENVDIDLRTVISDAPNKYVSERQCVSCPEQTLKVIDSSGVEIDACEKCGGIYFDEHEIKSMLPQAHEPLNSILAAFTTRDSLGRVIASLLY